MYPALFICHGGGPMPLLGDPGHEPMVAKWLEHVADVTKTHGMPSAIAVISAHYEAATMAVGGAAQPAMLFDYHGFPAKTYQLTYPAPGHPSLATAMAEALRAAGVAATVDPARRLDHGVFVPLMIMFPDASIPVIPLSVLESQDAAEHIRVGQTLRPFRERGVLFIGSGSSVHQVAPPGAGDQLGRRLTAALCGDGVSPQERLAAMRAVRAMDGFANAHPPHAAEHLMPLLTVVGTANGTAAREVACVPFMGAHARHYLFEN